jgi:XapX domain-containing protein
MSWQPFAIALGVGIGVGAIYGFLNVRSPAPPIIALVGLLGILIGETAVGYFRGHPSPVAHALHKKTFETAKRDKTEAPESGAS